VPEIMAQWGRVEALRWAGLSVSLTLNGGVMVGNFEHSTDVKVLIEIGLDSIKWFYVGAQRVNRLAELIVERLQRRDRVAAIKRNRRRIAGQDILRRSTIGDFRCAATPIQVAGAGLEPATPAL
jgi:hypothetical protein